jgi:uncharacterized membrane protein
LRETFFFSASLLLLGGTLGVEGAGDGAMVGGIERRR